MSDENNAFSTLPEELEHHILSELDAKSLLVCRQVCKQLKQHIDSRKNLQYLIELYAAGMEHNPNTRLPISDCLEMLQQYQKAWNDFDFARHDPLIIKQKSGDLWELYGGVLARTDIGGTFYFTRLPSRCRKIEMEEWIISPELNENIRDFGMDPSQDLLIWTTIPKRNKPYLALHIRTLGTGQKHPRAKVPLICHDSSSSTGDWYLQIRIMGDYIAIQAQYILLEDEALMAKNEILIWDWKKGERKLAIDCGHTVLAFTFVSERHIVTAVLDDSGYMEVEACLKIIDFQAEDNTMKSLVDVENLLTLCYPPFSDAFTARDIFEITSDPSPGWTPGERDQVPFYHAKDNRIFLIPIWAESGPGGISLLHVIPLSKFKQYTETLDLSTRPVLEWLDWGPEGTYLQSSTGLPPKYTCCAYGPRFIVGSRHVGQSNHPGELGNLTYAVQSYNFNQLGIRRNDLTEHLPHALPAGKPFHENVQTTLPFAEEMKCVSGYRVRRVMCSADNVILVDGPKREYIIYSL